LDDADIVELYWQRDESAIRKTETKYGQYCFSIAFNILSDTEDSKECVNDTWLRAWNAIPPSRPDRLRIFLAKITRNLSFDKYRLKAANKRGGGEITLALEELGETETKYGQYCFSIAFNILSDTEDSKECVNDTWLRAWNAIPPSRPDRLRIFLAKITRNLSFDKYRLKAANKRGGR
jgi:DNA-directed RNA polymerase specialized sigma24 family protein